MMMTLTISTLGLLMCATDAPPTNHAHHHYQMGVRAYAGTRHAATLYQEVGRPHFDPILGREDAADMEQLAKELEWHLNRLQPLLSTRETTLIGDEMRNMLAWVSKARYRTNALRMQLQGIGTSPVSQTSRREIRKLSQELFVCFSTILEGHEAAERKLGIGPPADPPSLPR